jgi:Flp pilus assembly protein TadD
VALSVREDPRSALPRLRAILRAHPGDPAAILLLEKALQALGQDHSPEKIRLLAKGAEFQDARNREAAALIGQERLAEAERLTRSILSVEATNPTALRLLAEIASRLGRMAEAELLLEKALTIAPHFATARYVDGQLDVHQACLAKPC